MVIQARKADTMQERERTWLKKVETVCWACE